MIDMQPGWILYVVALIPQLESQSYHARERAQVRLESVPPLQVALVADALVKVTSAEVGMRLNRCYRSWRPLLVNKRIRELEAAVHAALTEPVSSKPWRRLATIKIGDDEVQRWFIGHGEWASKQLHRDYPGEWSTAWDYPDDRSMAWTPEELAAVIWCVRFGHPDVEKMMNPNPEDW